MKLVKAEHDKLLRSKEMRYGDMKNFKMEWVQALVELEGSEVHSMKQAEEVHTHHGYVCDGCDQGPILGPRFACSTCGDYDLCATCEERSDHPHPLLKIVNP